MNEPLKLMFSQSIFAQSSVRKERIGAPRYMDDGRVFRYAHNGATALVVSEPTQAVDPVANHINCAPTANIAVGATKLSITLGATAATENYYQGGYIQINAGPGIGMQYRVASHAANAGSAALEIILDEPIQVAMTSAASKVSLYPNKFKGTVVSSAVTKRPTGVPLIACTGSYYYWTLTKGLGPVIVANAVVIGSDLTLGSATLALRVNMADCHVGILAGTGVTSQAKGVDFDIN